MAKSLMVMGTSPKSGKSFFISALCRIFADDGHKTVPFKAQSITSDIEYTEEGFEIDAQTAFLAKAAMKKPDIRMNPVLLKPCGEDKFDVTVCGKPRGEMTLAQYADSFDDIMPEVINAYKSLSLENDIILIEADGTPAEGLRYNIGGPDLAEMLGTPIIIISDYLNGGAFSAAYGSFAFADRELKSCVKGFIINNFETSDRENERNIAKLSEMAGSSFVSTFKRVDIASLRAESKDLSTDGQVSSDGIVKANPFFSSGSGASESDFRGDYGNAEDIFKSANSVPDTISEVEVSAFGFDEEDFASNEGEQASLQADVLSEQTAQNEYINPSETEQEPEEEIFISKAITEVQNDFEKDSSDAVAVFIDDRLLGDIEKNFADIKDTLSEKASDNHSIEAEEVEPLGLESDIFDGKDELFSTNIFNAGSPVSKDVGYSEALNAGLETPEYSQEPLDNPSDVAREVELPPSLNNNFDDIDELFRATEQTFEGTSVDSGKEGNETFIEKKYAVAGVEELEKEIDILKSDIENKIYDQNDSSSDDSEPTLMGNLFENIEKRITAINVSHKESMHGEPLRHNISSQELKPLTYEDVNEELFVTAAIDANSNISNDYSENETVLNSKLTAEAEKSDDVLGGQLLCESFEEIRNESLPNYGETSENFEAGNDSSSNPGYGLEHTLISLEVQPSESPLINGTDGLDTPDINKDDEVSEESRNVFSDRNTVNDDRLDSAEAVRKDEQAQPPLATEDELDKMFSFEGWDVVTNTQSAIEDIKSETPISLDTPLKDDFSDINISKTDNHAFDKVAPQDKSFNPSSTSGNELSQISSFSNGIDAPVNKKSETPSADGEEIDDNVSLERELKRDMEFLSEKDDRLIENVDFSANQTQFANMDTGAYAESVVPDIQKDDTETVAEAATIKRQNHDKQAQTENVSSVKAESIGVNSGVKVTIINLPHGTYKSGFDYLKARGIQVSYASDMSSFGAPDFIVIPDTLKPMSDLVWMRNNGLELLIKASLHKRTILLGICGGFHIFSESIQDPHGKDIGGEIDGMRLFKMKTVLDKGRKITKVRGIFKSFEGLLSPLNGKNFEGNAILSSRIFRATHKNISVIIEKESGLAFKDGICEKNVLGINVLGILQNKALLDVITNILMEIKVGKNIAAAYLGENVGKVMSFASNDEAKLSISPGDAEKISKKLANKNENPFGNTNQQDTPETDSPMVYNNYDNINGIIFESGDAFGGITSPDSDNSLANPELTEGGKQKDIDALAKYVKENLDLKKIYEIILKGV